LEEASIDSATRAKDRLECLRAPKPVSAAVASEQASNRSDGKPRATLRAARRQHLAPADRLHAAPKTMLAGAAKLRGLECTFHGVERKSWNRRVRPDGGEGLTGMRVRAEKALH
jgi:hypothetical protein